MPVLFADRDDAGRKLAETYEGPRDNVVILGIPRGGIPVGYHLAEDIRGILDVIVVRKLPVPSNPEAGFGAVAPDGSTVFNQEMVSTLRLTQREIEGIISTVLEEVGRREKVYRGNRPFPDLEGKNVVLTDDGLATGFTMIAAVKMARSHGPASVSAAVPVSPSNTVPRVEPLVDNFYCLYVSSRYPFGVASFYRDFHDLTDQEVIEYL